jgi:hypothetical protein
MEVNSSLGVGVVAISSESLKLRGVVGEKGDHD